MIVRLMGRRRFPGNSTRFFVSSLLCCLTFLILTTAHAQILDDSATWAGSLVVQSQRTAATDRHSLLDVPPSTLTQDEVDANGSSPASLPALLDALDVMQSNYFELWQGTWTGAIDWTAAVMGTHVAATLSAITSARRSILSRNKIEGQACLEESALRHENLVNRYFTQITSFYFGENAFALRTQAYDDMLWVVLGWLESIKFIKLHSSPDLAASASRSNGDQNFQYNSSTWYGHQFVPSFAHRAHLFYNLASKGWDTSLCGGGMVWNPYLAPYKNAITNQLYIAASVGMYLYHPGDDNPSPFYNDRNSRPLEDGLPPAKVHDTKYLNAAIEAYNWLKGSNMTNAQGLYVDGFHIHGYGKPNSTNGTGACDVRDEMVYTYNQGVLLSGLRGLYDATGTLTYLSEGHALIRAVIAATGWPRTSSGDRLKWAGLGRNGVLEEACDASGRCSQDGQTFKGIFFHHLPLFCAPLLTGPRRDGEIVWRANAATAQLHRKSCEKYMTWVAHNARAAWKSRNTDGEFGMWWGRPNAENSSTADGRNGDAGLDVQTPSVGTDYRNDGVPQDAVWRLPRDGAVGNGGDQALEDVDNTIKRPDGIEKADGKQPPRDPNTRGRGRTVETQSGGLAVWRAVFLLVHMGHGGHGGANEGQE